MLPANSWNPQTYDADAEAAFEKRFELFFWKLLPLTPLL